MVAKTIPQLKTDMAIGVSKSISATDIHNFIDAMGNRTTFSVKEFGAIGTDVAGNAAVDTAAFIAATAAAAASNPTGGGSIYVPAGTYYINSNEWILPERTKVFGDGYSTKIRKATNGWMVDVSGVESFVHHSYFVFRDIYFDGNDKTGSVIQAYYTSELLVDRCRFYGTAGPAVDAVELWDSRFQNCFFDWCGTATLPAFYLRNGTTATAGQFGYGTDCTNAVYFYGCRWESFKNGAVWMEHGPGSDNSALSQIYFTNCKCETHYLNGPVIKISNTTHHNMTNIHIDTLFISVNAFNSGYSTSTNLIDWAVNSACSLRNIWVFQTGTIGGVALVRSVVRVNALAPSNTIENIFMSGTTPTASTGFLSVIDFITGSDPGIKIMGHIGGTSPGLNLSPIAKNAGGIRALTADWPAPATDGYRVVAEDGITYTNNTGTGYTVTLPVNIYVGWKCRAIQLSTGQITFAAATGGTIISETGGLKTNGTNAMIEVWCYENTSGLTAPKFHLRGKSVT